MALPAIPNKGRRIRRFPLKTGETYVEGAPVLLDANGEIVEAGADPATILGFSASDAVLTDLDPDPGFKLVFVAYPDSTFLLEGTDTDPVASDVGEARDLDVDGNGVGTVASTTAATRMTIEEIFVKGAGPVGFYEVSILAANRQFQV
jgi:hypothetical protein